MKVEKHAASGGGTLEVIHHKNARAGLELAFVFERFEFEHCGTMTDTLIPRRDFDHQSSSPAGSAKRQLGSNERIVFDALTAAIADQAATTGAGCSLARQGDSS